MVLALESVTFDARDPERLGRFWGALLGRDPQRREDDVLLPGSPTAVGVAFTRSASVRDGLNLMHLHLTSESSGHQQATVERALDLGASHLDVGQRPEEGHVVLADPEGNEFCVLGPGNSFVAGCGFLGELACDGTRDVGVFWSGLLGWPLVWDRDEETAIQSPYGGTKVAWGGPPLAARSHPRVRLSLTATDPADVPEVVADPDGNPFVVRVA